MRTDERDHDQNGGRTGATDFDYDWVVIGSGFGGSVSALRLSEKGYRVAVLEAGRRFADEDFATSTWNLRRFLWAPVVGLRGIMRVYLFKDVVILAGAGVGGGSLVYANTLYQPGDEFFEAAEWRELASWRETLEPHYAEAKRMLGASPVPFRNDADDLLQIVGERLGVGDTYRRPEVSVYFGEPGHEGETVADPFFGGAGPSRTACTRCGSCMIGCRVGAKNTLVKNYLHLAERHGTEILPERTVKEIRPLGAADGSDGYAITSIRSGAWARKRRTTITARGVVVAAGAMGTNTLLARAKHTGMLPRLSDRVGAQVRTNSEALLAVTARDDRHDFPDSVAITSSIYPDADTHIENVTYGHGGGFMSLTFTMLTGAGSRITRPLMLAAQVARHPLNALRLATRRGSWSRRTMILLVMQTLPGSLSLKPRRLGRRLLLTTRQDPQHPNPAFIPAANRAAEILAAEMDGVAQSNLPEALVNTPATAHILGGAAIGADPDHGVVDHHQRAFGYENLLVCDGSVVPANPGVNPSLTITALAEHAMSHVPARSPLDALLAAPGPDELIPVVA
jgi:cholesterol oxidase